MTITDCQPSQKSLKTKYKFKSNAMRLLRNSYCHYHLLVNAIIVFSLMFFFHSFSFKYDFIHTYVYIQCTCIEGSNNDEEISLLQNYKMGKLKHKVQGIYF